MGHFFVSCPLGFEAELTHEIKDFWFEMIDLDGLPTRAEFPEMEAWTGVSWVYFNRLLDPEFPSSLSAALKVIYWLPDDDVRLYAHLSDEQAMEIYQALRQTEARYAYPAKPLRDFGPVTRSLNGSGK